MVTADQTGYVKYWQSNMNNVKMFQAHKEPVRAIRCDIFLITTIHFATAFQIFTLLSFNNNNLLENKHSFYQEDFVLCDDALPLLKNNNTKSNHHRQNKLLLIFSLSIINKEKDNKIAQNDWHLL